MRALQGSGGGGMTDPLGIGPTFLALGHAMNMDVVKGLAASHHHIQNHTQAPHIILLSIIGDTREHR